MSVSPILPTPLTDFAFLLSPTYNQVHPESLCAKLELQFLDCLEAYGARNVRNKCAELIYDMIECKKSHLQLLRAKAIQKERMKQYKEGKLSKPFDEYPPLDSYFYI